MKLFDPSNTKRHLPLWTKLAAASLLSIIIAGCGGSDAPVVTPPVVTPPVVTPPVVTLKSSFLVQDTGGAPVVGATVYAIPAADVAAIAAQPITLTSGNYTADAQKVDEPLEDLINGNYTPAGSGVTKYKFATTDAAGKAAIADLPTGATDTFFIYVKPTATDTAHLPGGSTSRKAIAGASLNNKETVVKVSTTPTAKATYVGSSNCIVCHSSYSNSKQTLHKLGIMVPNQPSGMQDLTKFSSPTNPDQDFNAGLKKFEGAGTKLYYYNAAATGASSFNVLPSSPTSGTVYFTLDLYKDASGYHVKFNNMIAPADANSGMVTDVSLTYGGGEHKQRYLTKRGNSLYVIPIQFNPQGSNTSLDSARFTWQEYNTVSLKWWDAANMKFTLPEVVDKSKSFDINCAGCHYTGLSLTKNAAGEYIATGAADGAGEVNPVSGARQELNVGCETCHGPGSEHHAAGGKGKFIVTPANITPEREVMICAQCHTRSKGNDGFGLKTESPLDSNNKMMLPGTSRATFLAKNTTQHDANASSDLWADGKHSKKHHQQATDFLQTKKYRNGTQLMTCASCHDVHAPGTDRHQLSGTSDSSLCKSCHTAVGDGIQHSIAKTGKYMGSHACSDCHVTRTAKTGSGNPVAGLVGASGTKYYQNDITSHLFDVPKKSKVSPTNAMPIPYTKNECQGCHSPAGL